MGKEKGGGGEKELVSVIVWDLFVGERWHIIRFFQDERQLFPCERGMYSYERGSERHNRSFFRSRAVECNAYCSTWVSDAL